MLSLLVLMATVSSAPAATVKPPYTAVAVSIHDGKTAKNRIWSDGVRTKTEDVDDKDSVSLRDESQGLSWLNGPSFGCLQMPIKPPSEMKAKIDEQFVANETVDGHPAKKYKVTTSAVINGKPFNDVSFVWKATDLGDLVIQNRSADGKSTWNLRNIVVGKVDPAVFKMPAACKYDEMADTTRNEPGEKGGYRTVRFSDASCKKLVPLPLSLSIPSDYAIRGNRIGCFWGTDADLQKVLSSDQEADFTTIERGVFWCRVSDSTGYDPQQNRFYSEDGTDDQWPAAFRSAGAKDVVMKRAMIGGLPALAISAKMRGTKAYMLYIGVGDSPAILINYHPPAGTKSADDLAMWEHFVGSIKAEEN